MSADGVLDISLDGERTSRRYGVRRKLAVLVLVVAGVGVVLAVAKNRTVDPPYLAPTWLPQALSADPSGFTFGRTTNAKAEITYGHADGHGGFDRYVALVRQDLPNATDQTSDETVVAERNGRRISQNHGQAYGEFFGLLRTPDCGATVWAKGVDRGELIDALLSAECQGQYLRINPFASMRQICRLPNDNGVWRLLLPPENATGTPKVWIQAWRDEGCSFETNTLEFETNTDDAESSSLRDTIAGRDTIVRVTGSSARAYFKLEGLTVSVEYDAPAGEPGDQPVADLRRILEGLRAVTVDSAGHIIKRF